MRKLRICRLFASALITTLAAGLGVCVAQPSHRASSTITNGNAIKMTSTSAPTSTFCAGRFLLDVPAGSIESGGNFKYNFIEIDPVKSISSDEFEMQVGAREAGLKSATNEKTKQSMLLQAFNSGTHMVVLASWKGDFSTALITVDGYRWMNDKSFSFHTDVGNGKEESGIKRMRDVLSRLRPRADSEIPVESGYCFAGGFIANPEWENEEAAVDIDIAGHPDAFVSVSIYPLASYKHDKPLLERMGGMAQALGNLATSVHVLRKGDRQIGPYKGQEYLISAPNSGGMRGHAFVWETQGEGTLDTPAIKIELTTGHQDNNGNPQKTKLTDQQAIKLWDDILNSFRLRPTGDQIKTSELHPEPRPNLPLGELVATGRTCPQTGWWQTSEAGEVEGGRRQRFVEGDSMPDVVLRGESSVWQKIKGERPSYRTATLWKLVGYDEATSSQKLTSAEHNVSAPQAPSGDAGSQNKG